MTTKKKTLTRSDIFGRNKPRIACVQTHCGEVHVRSLTEQQRADIEEATRKNPKHARALLIIAGVCDEEGVEQFGANDLQELMRLDSQITMALSNAVAEHIQPPDVETQRKNSLETPDDVAP